MGKHQQGQDWKALAMWTLFGASGWFASNAILAEMPIFIASLPAHESLGSQISMTIQGGSVLLFSYKVLDTCFKFSITKVLHVMMAIAIVTLFTSAFFWDIQMFGWSLPILMATLLGGGVGCMSNMTHWVFIMAAPAQCGVAASFGMCMGGILTNALAAFQMVGRDPLSPRIHVNTYFITAACFQAIWWAIVSQVSRQRGSDSSATWLSETSAETLLPVTRMEPPTQPMSERQASLFLGACNFFIHGAMYVLPSLLPFVAAIFPDPILKTEVMLWMDAAQQIGEAIGRLQRPQGARRAALFLCGPMFTTFSCLCALAAWPELLALISPRIGGLLLPGLVFSFCFSYGALQNTLFLKAREITGSIEGAERAASTISVCGQLGSVTTNLASFLLLNFQWRT